MNYIILDMEWNQGYPGNRVFIGDSRKTLSGEIIQIGAVKLDEAFNVVDTYSALIRPVFYRKMHFKVEQLTGITKQALSDAPAFSEAFTKFIQWCGQDHQFLIWGTDDILILRQNLDINKYRDYTIGKWYNLQIIYASQNESEHEQVALSTACEVLGIEQDLPLHNALNDALYTAKVCSKLDMKKGLADCLEKQRVSELNCKRKYRYFDFYSSKDAYEFASNNDNLCPLCSKQLCLCGEYVRKFYDRFVAVRSCEEHGYFVENLVVAKASETAVNTKYKTVKTVQRVKDLETAMSEVKQRKHRRRSAKSKA